MVCFVQGYHDRPIGGLLFNGLGCPWICAYERLPTLTRARRVKCDEAKPVCSRCRSTGRTCEGYGLWGGGGNTYVERYGGASTNDTSLVSVQKPPTKVLPVEELRHLQLYRIRIVHTTSGWFASKFWSSIVLPAASSEPAVLHAAHMLIPMSMLWR